MRPVFLTSRALVTTVAGVVLIALMTAGGARADDPSESQIQVRLVESRQHLNALYAESAAAAEQLNGANYRLEQARAELVTQRVDRAKAKKALDAQSQEVAAMAVSELRTGSTASAFVSLLRSNGPHELFERASARQHVMQAVTARLDTLDARRVVYDSANRAFEQSLDAQQRAVEERKSAQQSIDHAIDQAEAVVASTEAERRTLLRQLATAQQSSLAEVTRAQDTVDQRLDAAGPPGPPGRPGPSGPPANEPGKADPEPPPPPPVDPPPASKSKVETAIAFARNQLGEPYAWGGAGPSRWDCSGLTMRAWQAAGINLPHYAGAQYAQTKKIAVSSIRRGDLLYWSDGGPGSIYHVALYLGGGQMIQAPRPGRSVEIMPLSYWIPPDLASRVG